MQKNKELVYSAMICAIYCALTLCLAPLSFGAVQFRLSEALCMLAVISPKYIMGLTLGCALSNAIGFFMGVNILGAFDIIFGTLATLLAAVCSYLCRNIRIKNLPVLSTVFPALFNGVIIGAEISLILLNQISFTVFLTQALIVAIPEFFVCITIGLYIVKFAEKQSI